MFYALNWIVVVALLALWSLATWVLQALVVWTVSSADALSGTATGAAVGALPQALAPWLPPEVVQAMGQLMAGMKPFVDSLLQAAPALSEGLTVAAWVVWGIGGVLILLLGAGLHVAIALWRRRGSGVSSAHARRSLVAG